jgi:RNA polymerase sigma factor (sigma-70 family)
LDDLREIHVQHLFDSYCKKILTNKAKNIRTKRKRNQEQLVSFEGIKKFELNELPSFEIEKQMINSLVYGLSFKSRHLAEAISQLDDDDKLILYLCYFEEYSNRELSEFLNLSLSGAWYRRKKAIEKLKTNLRGADR